MKKNCFLLTLLSVVALSAFADTRDIGEKWNFHLGDVPEAHSLNYNDSDWRELNLPHDWAFENGYSKDGAQKDKGGYACGGIGWYRKTFRLTGKEQKAQKIYLDFDAVYRKAEVWINGEYLGTCPYGYVPFSFDVTSLLKKGDNVISVRVDNAQEPSARWYHGCGIYGNVCLRTHGDTYFEKNGTFVECADTQGHVVVKTLVNNLEQRSSLKCIAQIRDVDGVMQAEQTVDVKSLLSDTAVVSMNVPTPQTWSPEFPNLYSLHLKLVDGRRKVMDEQTIRIGFRNLDWDVQNGFYLNGRQYKIRGVCEHLEGGPTGAIYTPQLMRWKLQLIKDMGCNAVRTAHNPQLPFFYDLCDEMGLLVMDEIFDGWKRKADFDYGFQHFPTHWEQDLRTVIRRDRNHPSIFIYSLGNETQGRMASDMVRVCHEEDKTRLATSGTAESASMDVYGVNGHSEAKKFLETFKPTRLPFIATENPHTWQVRGYYRTKTWYRDGYKKEARQMMWIPDLTEKEIFTYDWTSPEQKSNKKQIFNSSYDNATVRVTARHILAALRDKPWFSGSFRWTGFDYLGEAGYVHGGWPFRAFQSGALDLAGFPKDLYYLYQSEWTDKDMVHILPHWSHPMMELGTKIPVWVYTNGDEVELFLNGKSQGRCKKGSAWNEIQCQFMVPWTPGTIEAVAYRKGQEIARTVQKTSEAPSQLGISVDNEHLKSDGKDISIVSIRQEDAKGTLYPYGENRVHVALEGPVRVLSFENGNPVDVETNFNASSRCCFFGLNRLFLQSTGGTDREKVSVVIASISGDKKLKQSNLVSINCVEKVLRGKSSLKKLHVYYTLDGSTPTQKSLRYQGAFPVEPNTVVKAIVCEEDKVLLSMTEAFGPNEGLYWGKNGEEENVLLGEQAEKMELKSCEIRSDVEGAYGGAYVVPEAGKGSMSWYQENDGGKMVCTLTIRYVQSGKEPTVMGLYNNGKLVSSLTFEKKLNVENPWKEKVVKLTVYPGANQLSLRNMGNRTTLGIDQIKLE